MLGPAVPPPCPVLVLSALTPRPSFPVLARSPSPYLSLFPFLPHFSPRLCPRPCCSPPDLHLPQRRWQSPCVPPLRSPEASLGAAIWEDLLQATGTMPKVLVSHGCPGLALIPPLGQGLGAQGGHSHPTRELGGDTRSGCGTFLGATLLCRRGSGSAAPAPASPRAVAAAAVPRTRSLWPAWRCHRVWGRRAGHCSARSGDPCRAGAVPPLIIDRPYQVKVLDRDILSPGQAGRHPRAPGVAASLSLSGTRAVPGWAPGARRALQQRGRGWVAPGGWRGAGQGPRAPADTRQSRGAQVRAPAAISWLRAASSAAGAARPGHAPPAPRGGSSPG